MAAVHLKSRPETMTPVPSRPAVTARGGAPSGGAGPAGRHSHSAETKIVKSDTFVPRRDLYRGQLLPFNDGDDGADSTSPETAWAC